MNPELSYSKAQLLNNASCGMGMMLDSYDGACCNSYFGQPVPTFGYGRIWKRCYPAENFCFNRAMSQRGCGQKYQQAYSLEGQNPGCCADTSGCSAPFGYRACGTSFSNGAVKVKYCPW